MSAGDFFENMWEKVKRYAFPHAPHMKTVSELQVLCTRIVMFSKLMNNRANGVDEWISYTVVWKDEHKALRDYITSHRDEVSEVLPTLDLERYFEPNPYIGVVADEEDMEAMFVRAQNSWFQEEMFNALKFR